MQREAGKLIFCVREASFSAMFAALGDEARQRQIRDTSPGKRHCHFLKQSANACESLPVRVEHPEMGVFPEGCVCPNNPYRKPDNLAYFQSLRDAQWLLPTAERMRAHLLMGDLPAASEMTPEERKMAEIVRADLLREDTERQELAVLSAIARAFSSDDG